MLVVCCMTFFLCSTVLAADYDHEITVQKISFSWKIVGPAIHIKLSAQTKGWVGIGFNPSYMMKGARFVLGYVKNGKTVITDQFGTGDTHHDLVGKLGGKSDVAVVGGKEEGGVTTLEFSLPLVPTDATGGKNIDPTAMTSVLLAYGPDFDSFLMKHKFRIKLSVNLSTGKYN